MATLWVLVMMGSLSFAQSDLLGTAQRQFAAGGYSSAISTLQSALADDHENAQAYYWLGRCYYELRDYNAAVTNLQRAIKSDPENAEVHHWLGRAYGEKADKEHSFWMARRVRRELEEAVRLSPKSIGARRDLMEFYADAPWMVGGSKDKARLQSEAISALDPVAGRLAWASYWRSENKPERVDAEYRGVLESKPKRIEPYMEIAEYYQDHKDPGRLEIAVEAAARLGFSDPRIGYYRGVFHILAGNGLGDAERMLRSYLGATPERSDFPSHASAMEWLGQLYEKQGKVAQAAEQYRAMMKSDPNRKGLREALRRVEK